MSRLRRTLPFLLLLLSTWFVPVSAQQPAEYPGLETGKMWTFDVPPLDYWGKRYDFHPEPQWLDKVRLGAVRYGGGCSASFVSPNGLVMTNHHCARECIVSATKEGEDFLTNGFYARTREEERACQGLFLDQLQQITDVTERVQTAIGAAGPQQAAKRRSETIGTVEKECAAQGGDVSCQVVTFYRGGQYKLYRFRRFNDVRLVMAPEAQIAFFGGDPDNFTYPRHDLDMSFVRAYVDGKPAVTEYFKWSTAGAREGDLVFVIGNPGSTGRLNTVAQLEYLRDVQYPATLTTLDRQIATVGKIRGLSEDRAKALRNQLFSFQNSRKAIAGYQSGLLDPQLMGRKRAWEQDFQAKVNGKPELRTKYGTAWKEIAAVQQELKSYALQRRWHLSAADGSRLLPVAMLLTRYNTEVVKPDSLRVPQFREANRKQTENAIISQAPVDTAAEIIRLTGWLEAMSTELPATDPVRRAALGSRKPADVAREMVQQSAIVTGDQRKKLFESGADVIAASQDPFLRLARVIDPLERANAKRTETLTSREAVANEHVARALLAVFGNSVAPDATFSLRITDGELKRYALNGTFAPAFTTFYGLLDRSLAFHSEPDWVLPSRWQERKDKLDQATPYNAVTTTDIIGGNSGSPVLNKNAEVVGLVFDGNMEMLPNRFLFTEQTARTVYVDSRAIVEALRKIYDAEALADELTGKAVSEK